MEKADFLLSGLGGQGILFMTKIVANAALNKGLDIMGAETHGMAQRGGSVVSHLRLGKVNSSLIRTGSADYLIALEENEAYRNLPYLASGGGMYVNAEPGVFSTPMVIPYLDKMGIRYRCLPAGKIAMELGAPMSSNLAMLGYFSAFENSIFAPGEFKATIAQVSPDRFRSVNLKVFEAGLRHGAKELETI